MPPNVFISEYTYQYTQLNAPIDEYSPHFQVLAFPCNQFGRQEPGENSEILRGIRYVRPGRDFKPNFPIFAKTEVNGQNEHPLYTFLKVQRCFTSVRFHAYTVYEAKLVFLYLRVNSSVHLITTSTWPTETSGPTSRDGVVNGQR